MRDPKRIYELLTRLEIVWAKYPDLRLAQIISNTFGATTDIFYVEDDAFVEMIEFNYPVKSPRCGKFALAGRTKRRKK